MGYVLLWIENLAVSLLLIALVTACVGRLHRRGLRLAIWAATGFLVFLAYLALTITMGIARYALLLDVAWFYPLLALMLFYIAGLIWLRFAGLRPKGAEPTSVPSATWSRGKLSIAFGIAVALHMMTLWNLDLEARQQLAALRADVGALALSVAPPRVPDSENAALLYEQAGQALSTTLNIVYGSSNKTENENWNKWIDSMDKPDFNPQDPELAQFLQQQAGTVALLQEAGKKPGCYFERNYNRPNIAMLLPELPATRNLAKLLALHARWKAAAGDYRAAMQDINAMFAMAQQISGGPLLITTLVGCALDGTAMETLQTILATHQFGSDELDVVKINGTFSYQKLMQRAFRMEEALRLSVLIDICKNVNYLESVSGHSNSQNNVLFDDFGLTFLFRISMLEREIKTESLYSDEINQLAAQPYYQTKDKWRDFSAKLNCNVPQSLLVRFMFPTYNRYVELMARGDAQRRVMELALAMCRFRAKNGKYPQKMADLVPDFITTVPVDPFDGKPIRLKQTDHGLAIYSIGPDGIDDNGAPYDQQTRKGDVGFKLPDKGD